MKLPSTQAVLNLCFAAFVVLVCGSVLFKQWNMPKKEDKPQPPKPVNIPIKRKSAVLMKEEMPLREMKMPMARLSSVAPSDSPQFEEEVSTDTVFQDHSSCCAGETQATLDTSDVNVVQQAGMVQAGNTVEHEGTMEESSIDIARTIPQPAMMPGTTTNSIQSNLDDNDSFSRSMSRKSKCRQRKPRVSTQERPKTTTESPKTPSRWDRTIAYVQKRIRKGKLTAVSSGVRASLKYLPQARAGNFTQYGKSVGSSVGRALVISNVLSLHKGLLFTALGWNLLDSCVTGKQASIKRCALTLGGIGSVGVLAAAIRPSTVPKAAAFGVARYLSESAIGITIEYLFAEHFIDSDQHNHDF